MKPWSRSVVPILFALAALAPSIALAENLKARPGDPAWMHLGANALLWAHITGGAIGMVTGVVALAARKGQRVHRAAGSVFVLAMFTAYAIGAGVAPFLQTGQRPNVVAGVMALYLLISGTMAARLRGKKAGAPEVIGLIVALCITAAGVTFMRMGAASPSGTVDGSPPQAFLLFTIAGVFAAAGEAHALLRKQLSRTSRIARHLWRMCFSLFIASGHSSWASSRCFRRRCRTRPCFTPPPWRRFRCYCSGWARSMSTTHCAAAGRSTKVFTQHLAGSVTHRRTTMVQAIVPTLSPL